MKKYWFRTLLASISNSGHFIFYLRIWLTLALGALLLSACHPNPPAVRPRLIAAPSTEFRGLWIATVDNTDWPSQPGLSPTQQQDELLHLLDRAGQLHINAILLQVRPSCDALYARNIEPWSVFLNGQAGVAPKPFYDPLAFAITEAHRRGMQLHAWINPFRVRSAKDHSAPAANSIEIRHPQWVRHYGNITWLDPGLPEVRDYSLSVIADIISRYNIDGIHIDDYFYPYPQTDPAGHAIDFPDHDTFARHGRGQSLADWRRSNINDFVHRLFLLTKSTPRTIRLGISPFGIWRPGNPPQVTGFDAYDQLYADSRLWLQQGWADYFTPQLYWPIDKSAQSFPVLLNWWQEQNSAHLPIYPGLNLAAKSATPAEIEYQIRTARGFACGGEILFGAARLLRNETNNPLFEHLQQTVFKTGQ